jgi:hypothetical protein
MRVGVKNGSLAVAVAVGGAVVVLWSNAPPRPVPTVAGIGTGATTAPPAPGGAQTADPVSLVAPLVGRQDPAAVSALIDIYGKLAGSPTALPARKLAFRALLAYPDMTIGLQAALAAIESDQTPKLKDPMWPELVQGVGQLWDAVTIEHGRDLVMTEQRPKPRDVLLESLAEVPPGKLSDVQRAALAADLIDLYPQLKAEQKPAMERALAALGGSDLVEILGRRGLADNSHLKAAVEERRAQEAAGVVAGAAKREEP